MKSQISNIFNLRHLRNLWMHFAATGVIAGCTYDHLIEIHYHAAPDASKTTVVTTGELPAGEPELMILMDHGQDDRATDDHGQDDRATGTEITIVMPEDAE